MSTKKINEFMAYSHFLVGMAKLILVVLVLMQLSANIASIANGGDANNEYFPEFSTIIGGAQLVLVILDIIMIIVNSTRQPEVIKGYLWGIGAIALEFVIPRSLFIYVVFAQCTMYIRAGMKIKNSNSKFEDSSQNKKMVKSTEWFYNENNNGEISEDEIQTIKERLEPEIIEWKKLLETGMIDEETYNKETNKIIEKEKRKIIKQKKKLNDTL